MKTKVLLFLTVVMICILMVSCGSSKAEIFRVVKGNQELLTNVPGEVKKLHDSSYSISTTEKRPIEYQLSSDDQGPSSYQDIKGLYLQVLNDDGSSTFSSLENDVFSDVLRIKDVTAITNGISDSPSFIEFDCSGEGFGSAMTYCGFYYAEDDLPIGWSGENVELTQYEKGWRYEEEGAGNIYYTERILDNWFYYQINW